MNLIEAILDWLLKKRVIANCEHDPYLHRWYFIRTKAFGIFIHKFVRSDWERDLHDHPWPFIVIPIWRGYIEWHECEICQFLHAHKIEQWHACETLESTRVYPFLGTSKREATYRHRVQLIDSKPAWSIFIRFRECQEWGFWTSKGWIKWNAWWQQNCE